MALGFYFYDSKYGIFDKTGNIIFEDSLHNTCLGYGLSCSQTEIALNAGKNYSEVDGFIELKCVAGVTLVCCLLLLLRY